MDWALARIRKDPGAALALLAIVITTALYAPTLRNDLVNYDDTVLLQSNWVVQTPSWSSIKTILFDLDVARRVAGAPEYLPVRDLSVMLDFAIWGDWYPGFHLTNLVLYLAAIALWFRVFVAFGIDRSLAGLAILLWALHPTHAESVAWLSERKGLLGALFAGGAALGYARFRAGRSPAFLVAAALLAVCAVWSKAIAAFGVAGIAGLEVALPSERVSWRRSLVGLAVIAVVAGLAFVPVLEVASRAAVVGTDVRAPGGRAETVIGVLGFYLRLGAMLVPNAVSYPIATDHPSVVDLILGAIAAVALVVAVVAPARLRIPPVVRAAAAIWLVTWIPVSHLILPLQMIFVADRYLLLPTLGLALALAFVVLRIGDARLRRLLAVVLILASALRTLDASSSWRDSLTLWERAAHSNPRDPDACASYAQELINIGHGEAALPLVDDCLQRASSPRLVLRRALLLAAHRRFSEAIALMRTIATPAYPQAMMDIALLLDAAKRKTEALDLAREVTRDAPAYAAGHRTHGKLAFAAGLYEEARREFERAFELDSRDAVNRYNLGLTLVKLGRRWEAYPHLASCLIDPAIGGKCRVLLNAR